MRRLRASCALACFLTLGASGCSANDESSRSDFSAAGGGGSTSLDAGAPSGSGPTGGSGPGIIVVQSPPDGGGSDVTGPNGCRGLVCQKPYCEAGVSTTISGKVYDPSGTLPLYNVMVYVPNAPLSPLTEGANCLCEVNGEPIAAGLSDTSGHFVVRDAPAGTNIPLVIQVGKWRRQFTVPSVASCADSAVPDGTLRLPGRQADGDMPKVALTTGAADALECLIPKLGIDPAEITNPDGTGRFHYFAGHEGANRYAPSVNGGAMFPAASSVWSSVETLKPYDVILLSCEGDEYREEKGDEAFKAMAAYTALGGRMFASHWHQIWLKAGPYPESIAQYTIQPDLGALTATVVTSFPKGQALSEWLVAAQASPTIGQVSILNAQHTIVKENPAHAKAWIVAPTSPQASVQYLSANTPMDAPADKQCGRIVLSDLHVVGGASEAGTDTSSPAYPFPTGCVSSGLTPQEKVLAFMLFDITACTIPDTKRPEPPPIK